MELTQEFIRQLFDYRDDGYLIWKIKFARKIKIGSIAGCIAKHDDGFRRHIRINDKLYLSSRLIFLYHKGYLPKYVDHIDVDSLNDRIGNLREASSPQNSSNRRKRKNLSSKYLGVCLLRSKQWQAGIRSNYKQMYLGRYDTEHEAALAYNKAAVKYFGEFANLNIIQP